LKASDGTLTGSHETVEDLIRYAARRFTEAGVEFRPSKMSKLIRNTSRISLAREAIDAYLTDLIDRVGDRSWRGFELFVNGYADPTGAHAVRSLQPGKRWQDDRAWAVATR
jgi:hypothetical protein